MRSTERDAEVMEAAEAPRVVSSVIDGVGHLRVNRPGQRNAIDARTVSEAQAVMDAFASRGVLTAVLEAEGTVFCAGGDRSEDGTTARSASTLVAALVSSPIFWAARVHGPALGGGVALAAVCPLVACTPEAWFELPEVEAGFLPTPVLAYLEPRLGPRRALHLCLFPERISAARAVEAGLADQVVAAESIDAFLLGRLLPLARSRKVAEAASRSWQSHFSTEEFRSRLAYLMSLL